MGRLTFWVLLGLTLFAVSCNDVLASGGADVGPSESECRPHIEKAINELKTGEPSEKEASVPIHDKISGKDTTNNQPDKDNDDGVDSGEMQHDQPAAATDADDDDDDDDDAKHVQKAKVKHVEKTKSAKEPTKHLSKETDIDGDGIPNEEDGDIDGDVIPNEQDDDMDGDGILNIHDDDIDGDVIPNEKDPDMDGDGVLNVHDKDIDGDGVPNVHDNDLDGDGIPNDEDDDMDGDGIPNDQDEDMDGDGIPNDQDNDIDGDGIPNEKDDDIDGDGIPNDEDDDMDGDGLLNEDDEDIDGDGIPNEDDEDLDGDGVTNEADADIDGDGIVNADDEDLDGDGIVNDADVDIDGDGIANPKDDDIDGDGITNKDDRDMDGDGVLDHQDDDIDSDGIPNEKDDDFDGDGIPNEHDDDDDQKLVADEHKEKETSRSKRSVDAAPVPDKTGKQGKKGDIDGDGVPDHEDSDRDGDGTPDHQDDDIDGDGIPNAQDTDIDGDGIPNAHDDDIDGDGILNAQDGDTDGDGVPDHQDDDIDGDGIPNTHDGDIDGDGIPNAHDGDRDGDGVPNEHDEESEEDTKPEDELLWEGEIPENLRNRQHITELLQLDEEFSAKEKAVDRVAEIILRDIKRIYENAIKPLETLYKYRDLSNRHFGDPEIFSKPLILFMGPWSGGKSSIINYLTGNEYTPNSLRTGAEPSPAYFNILMWGNETEVLDGTQLAADYTFSGLQKFGQGLEDRLRGLKMPSKLLEKVNIVEIPGILEVRKQVSRLFPFNDACQWFIDRADIIFLVYDPAKLDVGPETEAILDQLKGREYQTRIVLNKADTVKPEELLRVQSALIWNISPLMSSAQPPLVYTTSLWSHPLQPGSPARLLLAQERAFLRDLRTAVDKRIEHKIASARRFAVRVRNHAKMVDCYLNTFYNHKTLFGNKKRIADNIINHPENYHIYEGLSTLTNISRYDLPDPEVYRDFFRLNSLYEFKKLAETCTYFRGCPIAKLDVAIAYDLPELAGKYKKMVEAALTGIEANPEGVVATTSAVPAAAGKAPAQGQKNKS